MSDIEQNSETTLPLPSLKRHSFGGVVYYTDDSLFEHVGVRIAFTGRHSGVGESGVLDLSRDNGVVDTLSLKNRKHLLNALTEGKPESVEVVNPRQVHGDHIIVVNDRESLVQDVEADGVICTTKNIAPMLLFADCCPVILVSSKGVLSVVHAGWRGVVNLISRKALTLLVNDFSCETDFINAYVGPHIGSCCFEVSNDVKDQFLRAFGNEVIVGSTDKPRVDLSLALKKQLLAAGLSEKRFLDLNLCTCCNHDHFFSYRKGDEKRGRQAAIAYRC